MTQMKESLLTDSYVLAMSQKMIKKYEVHREIR